MIEPIRLLGFAFASADLLFEIDREGTILFATGAISLFSTHNDLNGRVAAELFQPEERARFASVFRGLTPGGRVGPLPAILASGDQASLSMCFLPQSDRISCTLVKPGKRGAIGGGKDKETGLADTDAFLLAASEKAGSKGAMAMVNVPSLPDVCAKLSPQDAAKLMAGIGNNISTMGAIAAARLSQTRFGVVTEDPHGARTLAGKILAAVRERGLGTIPVEEVLLSLKGRDLTPEQTVLALRYAVTRFADGKMKKVASADLGDTFDRMMDETIARAQTFNMTVADGAFELAFEPIIDLKSGTPSHYEALTRFKQGESPGETIKFAEELGLTDAFDMAVALKAFAALESDPTITASVAVNVSGRTFANNATFAALAGLFAKKRALAKRVLIEITESAAIPDLAAADTAIQSLRKLGYRVGIDDFGSGAASLQYLHSFTVDFVKVDGAVIQRMGKSPREDALLKSMLATCAELEIETVAEWIDSPEKLKRCREIGFHFGQGRQFGSSLTELPKVEPATPRVRRKGEQVSWG